MYWVSFLSFENQGVISSIAEEESRTISANVSWGVQKRFSRGIPHIPTTYFLGYDEGEDGKLVINEEEAKVVRRIFQEYLSGKGSVIIAKGLTKDKVKTARGNTKWTADSVCKILRNEKFSGSALCQKSVTLDPLTHRRVRNVNHKPQYLIRNNHPAIIREEDWNMVQKELDRRGKMKHDPDGKYRQTYSGKAPFSNMLYCGECGMPVHRRRLTSRMNGRSYQFTVWHCRLAAKKVEADFDCHSKYVWEEVIEQAYKDMILKMTKETELIRKEGLEAIADVSLTDEETERLKELEEIIDRINDRISEMSLRESITNDSIYDATLRSLIYESQIYQQEHEALMKNQDEGNYLKMNLEALITYLENTEDFETFDATTFKQIVERGILHKDYEIEFIFKCGVKRVAYGWRRGKNPVEPLDNQITEGSI